MIKLTNLLKESRFANAVNSIQPNKTVWLPKGNSGYTKVSIKNVSLDGSIATVDDRRGNSYTWDLEEMDFIYEDPKVTAKRLAAEQEAARKKAEWKAKEKARKDALKPMSKQAYEKELEGIMSDAKGDGNEEATYDMASNLIYDSDIVKYINYHYPEYKGNERKVQQRIQWDLESYL